MRHRDIHHRFQSYGRGSTDEVYLVDVPYMGALDVGRHSGIQVDTLGSSVLILTCPAAEDADSGQPSGSWRAQLAAPLREMHRVGIVGAKRVDRRGRTHAMGEMVIHPKGFHRVGATLPAEAHQFAVEVDAVCGGVVAIDRPLFHELGGEAAFSRPFDMLMSCLEARRRGWRIIGSPRVMVRDESTIENGQAEDRGFELRFGFDWRAADLDQVRRTHAGSGLLWNERFFASGSVRYGKYASRPMLHWKSYVESPEYRSRADGLISFLEENLSPGARVLDFGCGDGLFTHLLASRGFEMHGVDIEPEAIEQGRAATAAQTYPAKPPTFTLAGDDQDQPAPAGPFDAAIMLDVIEHLPNPSRTLRELHESIVPHGRLVAVTPEARFGQWSDPVYHVTEYTHGELLSQLQACGFRPVTNGRIGEPYRDLIVVAERA